MPHNTSTIEEAAPNFAMLDAAGVTDDYARRMAEVIADPVKFTQGLLGHRVWHTAREIMTAVATDPRKKVAVKACHASSKTFTAAELTLWWLARYKEGVVVTTAPTWLQVKRVLWSEIRNMIATSRISWPEPTETGIRLSDKRYAVGLSTKEGVRFQGFHGQVLIILDEAPGVPQVVYDAIEGIMAGGDVRLLLLGNPLINSGPFYDAFGKNKAEWATFTISAYNTPNLAGITPDQLLTMTDAELADNPWPFLTTRRWVRDRLKRWGASHPLYLARVLGLFPLQASDSVFSLAWIEGASQLYPEPETEAERELADRHNNAPLKVGIDVAGPGENETVMIIHRDGEIIFARSYEIADPRGEVLADLHPYREAEAACRRDIGPVVVDSNGIGYYMACHLLDAGYDVRFANAGASPNDDSLFTNQKAEMYWTLREAMEAGKVYGLVDDTCQGQLASIRYKHTATGKIAIEGKDDAKKRGVDSPDRAEALALAFANVAPPAIGGIIEEHEPVQISRY